jgi:hypothetical protein
MKAHAAFDQIGPLSEQRRCDSLGGVQQLGVRVLALGVDDRDSFRKAARAIEERLQAGLDTVTLVAVLLRYLLNHEAA